MLLVALVGGGDISGGGSRGRLVLPPELEPNRKLTMN